MRDPHEDLFSTSPYSVADNWMDPRRRRDRRVERRLPRRSPRTSALRFL